MNAEATKLLTGGAAYAWFDRPPARDTKATMERALLATFGALKDDISVTEHFPEPYLVRFIYPHHCANAVACHDLYFEGLKIQVRSWRLKNLGCHVRWASGLTQLLMSHLGAAALGRALLHRVHPGLQGLHRPPQTLLHHQTPSARHRHQLRAAARQCFCWQGRTWVAACLASCSRLSR
jgi:hypothetical protein